MGKREREGGRSERYGSNSMHRIVAAVTLLLEMFGLTVLTLLLSPLNCTYHPDLLPTLDIDPSIICWQGRRGEEEEGKGKGRGRMGSRGDCRREERFCYFFLLF